VVSQWKWTFNEIAAVSNGWQDKEAGALLTWAIWTTDSLSYLERVDEEAFGGQRRGLYEYHPSTVDLAHVRWASGSAITAIDLCAGVLGRKYYKSGGRELALSDFFGDDGAKLRALLPTQAALWVTTTNGHHKYQTVKRARKPMTHSVLARTLQLTNRSSGPHEHRTLLPVGPKNALIDARDLVLLAGTVARRHVELFLDDIMTGKY
jgi:hypothetical protein